MKKMKSTEELEATKKEHPFFLLYVGMEGCNICHSDKPKVEELSREMKLPAYEIDYNETPSIRGCLNIFTVPVVLLFREGREVHRQARIIALEELRYRIEQMGEGLKTY